jgi:GDP-4-dehydro-6-deoxy-D-mannose reductase
MTVQSSADVGAPDWERAILDLTDDAGVDRLVSGLRPDIIVHMAAQSSVGQAADAPEATWRVNATGTETLANAVARHAPASLFMFTSTAEVYGASFLKGPATEDTPTAPVNAYAESKLAAEMALRAGLPDSTRLIIMRAFNHSGPGHDERFVLPAFAAQVARAESGGNSPVVKVGNLDAERDFLHVIDVVEAYASVLRVGERLPARTLLNVASGRAWRLGDLLDQLCRMASRPIEIVVDPERMRPSDIPRVVGDATRLRNLTGWAPRLTVADLLQDLLRSFRNG